jgi:hypothetical protein
MATGIEERSGFSLLFSVCYSQLGWKCQNILILLDIIAFGAGEGNRTLVSGLGSPRSTIEPHPQNVE